MAKRSKATTEADELAGIPDPANAAEFEALSEADKAKITGYYETHPNPKGVRPLNAAERRGFPVMPACPGAAPRSHRAKE